MQTETLSDPRPVSLPEIVNHMTLRPHSSPPELILGNANRRFSGVTSTMLQVLAAQRNQISTLVLGEYHLPQEIEAYQFLALARRLRQADVESTVVVFHARRNIEIIQALLLKQVAKCQIKILFTSTAQRHHTAFTRWLMTQVDSVISTCSAAASYLKPPPETLIPHGIDADRYRPDASDSFSDLIHLSGAEYHIGLFGRVRPQKGVDILVKASIPLLQANPNWEVVFIGQIKTTDQSFVDQLKTLAAKAGVEAQIRFLGEQPFNALPSLFNAMTIVTALSRNEGYGLTVLEAMSSGKPVVASRAGAWPDIIEHDHNGCLVDVDDIEATRSALERLIQNPNTRERLGNAARQHVLARYTIQSEAEALLSHYRRLAARH